MSKDKIKNLEKAVAAGYKARRELDKIESAKRDKQNKKLVGKCFRVSNRYSSSESWWLYTKITGVEDGWLKAIQFQKTSSGHFEIWDNLLRDSREYKEITPEELNQAWLELMTELHSIGG